MFEKCKAASKELKTTNNSVTRETVIFAHIVKVQSDNETIVRELSIDVGDVDMQASLLTALKAVNANSLILR